MCIRLNNFIWEAIKPRYVNLQYVSMCVLIFHNFMFAHELKTMCCWKFRLFLFSTFVSNLYTMYTNVSRFVNFCPTSICLKSRWRVGIIFYFFKYFFWHPTDRAKHVRVCYRATVQFVFAFPVRNKNKIRLSFGCHFVMKHLTNVALV